MLRRNSFRLARHPASVRLARHRVRDHLTAWGHLPDAPALGDALLVVSELATNAVRHGPVQEREFEIAVTALADGSCLLEVSDENHLEPRIRLVGDNAEHGRGLRLVDQLAAAWGVWSRGRHGKTVWALIRADQGEGWGF